MSAAPVPNQRISIRVARVFVIALIFVCAGTLIAFALQAILYFGYAVLWDARFMWPALTSIAEWAGFTGLIAGVYDATCDRVDARTMLVISLVMVLAAVILALWGLASVLISRLLDNLLIFIVTLAVVLSTPTWPIFFVVSMMCFVVSMMTCWKLIDVARDRIPAVGSLLGQ